MAVVPLASFDDLQKAMGRSLNRDVGEAALARASAAVRGWCGWSVTFETVTDEVHNASRYRRKLFLPTLHLVSVTSVVEDGVTLTADVDYAWDTCGIVWRATGWWTTNVGGLVVSYTHGYSREETKFEIARTVALAAAVRIMSNPYGHQSESTGTESWVGGPNIVGATLTSDEKRDLGPLMIEALG